MEFICPVCGEPLFFNEDRGKYEAYEIFGHWSCSRACAIKQEYALGTIREGAKVGSKCTKCGKTIKVGSRGVMFKGEPYCDDICLNLHLLGERILTVREFTEEELAKNWVRWSNYV